MPSGFEVYNCSEMKIVKLNEQISIFFILDRGRNLPIKVLEAKIKKEEDKAENYVKFLLLVLVELTNRLHCTS